MRDTLMDISIYTCARCAYINKKNITNANTLSLAVSCSIRVMCVMFIFADATDRDGMRKNLYRLIKTKRHSISIQRHTEQKACIYRYKYSIYGGNNPSNNVIASTRAQMQFTFHMKRNESTEKRAKESE